MRGTLIDTHCHLDFEYFQSDLDAFIKRALAQNLQNLITISTKFSEFPKVLAIAERFPQVFCSVGVHPNNCAQEPDVCANTLVTATKHPKVVAIGETGLDYHYGYSTREQQTALFLQHIEAARLTELPLVIHTRNADVDMARILTEEVNKSPFSFILHCYSSGPELASIAIDLGGYISFSGILTFKNAGSIREIAQTVPHERLLVETDAPYLAPVPYRGQQNEPAFVVKTAQCLAEVLGMDFEELAKITTDNAQRIFKKLQL